MKPRKALIFISILIFLGIVGFIDFLLPVDVTSYAFYLIPIGATAWLLGFRPALFVCLVSTVLWTFANPELMDRVSNEFVYGWNILVRLSTFFVFAFVINRLRMALLEKDDLIRRLRRTLSEASTQEHIHPVCRECGAIRLNKDHWVTTNQFLSRKTDRDFATTYCGSCLEHKKTGERSTSSSNEN